MCKLEFSSLSLLPLYYETVVLLHIHAAALTIMQRNRGPTVPLPSPPSFCSNPLSFPLQCFPRPQAIKIVDKTTRRRLGRAQISNEQKIRREIAIMKKCIHPNVVRLIEVIDDPRARKIYLGKQYPTSTQRNLQLPACRRKPHPSSYFIPQILTFPPNL